MNDKIDDNTIKTVAKLSRLKLNQEQTHKFATQLSNILSYIEKLNQLDTNGVEPMAHCLPISNVLRKDEPIESIGSEKILQNAPQRDKSHFLVPKILEDSSA